MSCRVCGCPCSDLCPSCKDRLPIRCQAGCGSYGPLLAEPDGTLVCGNCYAERQMESDLRTLQTAVDDSERTAKAANAEYLLAKAVVDEVERLSKRRARDRMLMARRLGVTP